jgi:hypothetical protein
MWRVAQTGCSRCRWVGPAHFLRRTRRYDATGARAISCIHAYSICSCGWPSVAVEAVSGGAFQKYGAVWAQAELFAERWELAECEKAVLEWEAFRERERVRDAVFVRSVACRTHMRETAACQYSGPPWTQILILGT